MGFELILDFTIVTVAVSLVMIFNLVSAYIIMILVSVDDSLLILLISVIRPQPLPPASRNSRSRYLCASGLLRASGMQL